MIFKIIVSFFMFRCCVISASIVLETNPKSVIPVPTFDWTDIKGHSYLRLATPSGNIYHFTDDKGIVRELGNVTDMKELPFLTVASDASQEYYIYLRKDETGYQAIRRVQGDRMNLPHRLSLQSFTGVDKKLYYVSLSALSVEKANTIFNDFPVDYLEFLIRWDNQLLAFTFTEDGSDLVDMVDCTKLKLLMRAQGNPSNSSLPYITYFEYRDGHWYDIFFPANVTGCSLPYLMRNRSKPRDKCGRIGYELKKFKGPDNKQYELEPNWTLDGEGRHYFKVGHSNFDSDVEVGDYRIYRIADYDRLELIGQFHEPYTRHQYHEEIMNFKCLLFC